MAQELSVEERIAKCIAPVKPDFLYSKAQLESKATEQAAADHAARQAAAEEKPKLSKRQQKKEAKGRKGVCNNFLNGRCRLADSCRFSHDLEGFLLSKGPDLPGRCPFSALESCPYGVGCRYLGSHTSKDPFQDRAKEILCNKAQGKGNSPQTEGGREVGSLELPVPSSVQPPLNSLDKNVQHLLWKNRYDFTKANSVLKSMNLKVTSRPVKQLKDGKGEGTQQGKGEGEGEGQPQQQQQDEQQQQQQQPPPLEQLQPQQQQQKQQQQQQGEQAQDRQQLQDAGPQEGLQELMRVDEHQGGGGGGSNETRGQPPLAADGTAGVAALQAPQGAGADPAAQQPAVVECPATKKPRLLQGSEGMVTSPTPPAGDAPPPAAAATLTGHASGPAPPITTAACGKGAETRSMHVETPLRREEKKIIDFRNKTILAPLTTVGNLPFRRICKTFGADVTVGEMALATNLLQGQASEWALLKRHPCEDLFGVQIAGGFPDSVARTCQLIDETCPAVDFVDINCGCPIDIVCDRGAGSALLLKPKRLEDIARAADQAMSLPLTIKTRKGYYDNSDVTHTFVRDIRSWGPIALTLHGRTRQQRYSRLADWDYITRCAEAAAPSQLQLIGNGDVLSFTDWNEHMGISADGNTSALTACMIGRGALIKPWLFQEIKEQRHIDISASERLDMLRSYCAAGLEHWGSDARGVETTRKFLLEFLSYLHRYIPVGLMEVLPQRLNWRPPAFFGRNDLETLFASENPADWIHISEMLLGPVPPGFTFTPKHKSNSYSAPAGGTAAAAAYEADGIAQG